MDNIRVPSDSFELAFLDKRSDSGELLHRREEYCHHEDKVVRVKPNTKPR